MYGSCVTSCSGKLFSFLSISISTVQTAFTKVFIKIFCTVPNSIQTGYCHGCP